MNKLTLTQSCACQLSGVWNTYTRIRIHTQILVNVPRVLNITAMECEGWLGLMRVLLDFNRLASNNIVELIDTVFWCNELVWVLAAHTNISTHFPPLVMIYLEMLSSVMEFYRTERAFFSFAVINNLSLSSGVQFIS